MYKKIITIPRIFNNTTQKDIIEWQIPGQVSVALTPIDQFGYTLMAKVKVEKQHWWNRSWKTFITHSSTPAEAVMKGVEFLENCGYTIDHANIQFEK